MVNRARIETAVLNRIHQKIIKSMLEVIILSLLKDGEMSGYGIIAFVHRKFQLLLSPGTIYPLLYTMEKRGLIRGRTVGNKKLYSPSDRGFEALKELESKYFRLSILFEGLSGMIHGSIDRKLVRDVLD